MSEAGRRRWAGRLLPALAALALVALVALVLAACGGGRLTPADAAARVDRENIPYAEFEDYVSSRVGLDAASSSLVLSRLLDQFLDEVLLRFLALEEGLATAETPGWEVVDALLAGHPAAVPTNEEIAAYYRSNRASFRFPERVMLRQVLAEDSVTAERIRELLRADTDFGEIAGRFLDDGVSASEGEITREDLPAAFVDKIFGLAPGEVSEVVAADYGFHVFQVVASLPAEEAGLAEAAPEIVDVLGLESRRRALEELVTRARGRYNVEVYARNLPFNYEGRYEEE